MKIGKGAITAMIIILVMSISLFFVLTLIQREMLKDTVKETVVLANKDIPAGTILTESNVSDFLKEEEVSSALVIQETYKTKSELIGKYVTRTVSGNEIVYAGVIGEDSKELEKYENPIELSLSISKNASAVAGTIRKGDYVNVYAVVQDANAKQSYELVLEKILVNEVYDENTSKIAMSDKESVALTFTFYMEEEAVPELLGKLQTKEIFAVKVK